MPKPIVEEAKLYYSIRNICLLLELFLRKYHELHEKLDMFLLHTYMQVKKEFGKESKRLFDLLKTIHGDETQVEESLKMIEVQSETHGDDKNLPPPDERDNKRMKSMMSSRFDRSQNMSSAHPALDESITPLDISTLRPTKQALKEIEHAKIRRD